MFIKTFVLSCTGDSIYLNLKISRRPHLTSISGNRISRVLYPTMDSSVVSGSSSKERVVLLFRTPKEPRRTGKEVVNHSSIDIILTRWERIVYWCLNCRILLWVDTRLSRTPRPQVEICHSNPGRWVPDSSDVSSRGRGLGWSATVLSQGLIQSG